MLKLVFTRYCLPVPKHGVVSVMCLTGWLLFLRDARLVGPDKLTEKEAVLIFTMSRMYCSQEQNNFLNYCCLTFVDFLEAVGDRSIPCLS